MTTIQTNISYRKRAGKSEIVKTMDIIYEDISGKRMEFKIKDLKLQETALLLRIISFDL